MLNILVKTQHVKEKGWKRKEKEEKKEMDGKGK